jgi:hypothetical protein
MEPIAFKEREGKSYTRIAMDPCASQWFARFAAGCKERRMGQDTRPNRCFSVALLHKLLDRCLVNAKEAKAYDESHNWVICGGYYAACYIASLRGLEGRFMDLAGLIEYWETTPGVTDLVLCGKIKGEHQSRSHMLPCVNVTGSGVNLKLWMGLVLAANRLRKLTDGPAFCDKKGFVLSSQALDKYMHLALIQVLERDPEIFPKDIRTREEIRVRYHCFRTLRQTSAAQARNMGISTVHTNVINRWSKAERAGAKQASLPMNQHYAQIEELVLPSFKAYMSKM